MFRFWETDIREQTKYEKRIQTSVGKYSTWSALWNQVWKSCKRQK